MFGGGRRRLSRALRRRDARTRVSPEAVSPPSPAPNGGELDFGGSKDSVRGGNSDSPTFLHAAALPASFSRRKNEGSR